MWLLISIHFAWHQVTILLEKEREGGGPIIMGNVTTSDQPNFPCPVDQDICLSIQRLTECIAWLHSVALLPYSAPLS